MLLQIIKKEILSNIKTPKFYITYILCFVLIILAIVMGINDYRSDLKEYSSAISLNQKEVESKDVTNFYNILVYKRPSSLSSFVSGIEGNLGKETYVSVFSSIPQLSNARYSNNPIFAIFGALDFDFLVRIILSLFAILFTYDAISGEREKGTLKLIMSNHIPRDVFILGKAIGGFISLFIPFIIPFLMGLIIYSFYPDIVLNGESFGRIFLLFVFYMLYLIFFFTLGLFVSSKTSRSSISFLILLFSWVLIVIVIPKGSVMVSRQIYKVPSAHEIEYQKRQIFFEIYHAKKWDDERDKFIKDNPDEGLSREEWYEKYNEFRKDQEERRTKEIEEKQVKIDQDYKNKQITQRNIAMIISRISPSSALRYSTMNIGKTGIYSYERFLNSVKSYKEVFKKYATDLRYKNRTKYLTNREQTPKVNYAEVPKLKYKDESVSESFNLIIPDLIVLIFYIILFFVLAYISFMKYDVR